MIRMFSASPVLLSLLWLANPSEGPCPEAQMTHCDELGGSSSCGAAFNCIHSATVVCGNLIATVTYDTTCQLPIPPGGTVSFTKVQSFLKSDSTAITNRCNCKLQPSLGRNWGDICCQGDCCECFDLACN